MYSTIFPWCTMDLRGRRFNDATERERSQTAARGPESGEAAEVVAAVAAAAERKIVAKLFTSLTYLTADEVCLADRKNTAGRRLCTVII